MKRNTFYLLAGVVALIEVGIFWLSVEIERPILIQAAFVLGVLLIYIARRRVDETIEDERTAMITQKAALRTLEVFWVVFFAVSLGSAVIAFSRPLGLRPPHPGPPEMAPPDVLTSDSECTTPANTENGILMKNRIKVYRAMHDLTQEGLANELGVTRQTILAIEKGKYDPSLELAFKIARFFGVTIEEIFIYDSTPGPKPPE